jgi:hypothetical protein
LREPRSAEHERDLSKVRRPDGEWPEGGINLVPEDVERLRSPRAAQTRPFVSPEPQQGGDAVQRLS